MEAIQFIDVNKAIVIDDGNSYIGTQLDINELDGGVGLQAKSIEEGGIPRIKVSLPNESSFDYVVSDNSTVSSDNVFIGGDSYSYIRGLISEEKNVQTEPGYLDFWCGFPVDVINGVNNAIIVDGVVSQRVSFDDICLDRLSRIIDYPYLIKKEFNTPLDNINAPSFIGSYSHIFVFIDEFTGKIVKNPASRWTQIQGIPVEYQNSILSSVGFALNIVAIPIRNNSVSSLSEYNLFLDELIFLEDGKMLRINSHKWMGAMGSNTPESLNEIFADSNLQISVYSDSIEARLKSNYDNGNLFHDKERIIRKGSFFLSNELRNPDSSFKLFPGFCVSLNANGSGTLIGSLANQELVNLKL